MQLIHKPENIRYLTGFVGSFGIALHSDKKTFLITDGRYQEMAKKLCHQNIEIIIIADDLKTTLTNLFKKLKIQEISLETDFLSYQQVLGLRKNFPKIKFQTNKTTDPIAQLRQLKSAAEIKLIKKAQEINEQTLSKIITTHLKQGINEREIALLIERIGQDLGAEKCSFAPIVAFGKNSASPHYTPDATKLQKGMTVLIDMGMVYQGYMSDMTRTFFTAEPTTKQREIYNLVLTAQTEAIKAIKPHIPAQQIDIITRNPIASAGYGDYFTHSSGHGIGLEIHEAPSFSQKAKHLGTKQKLQPQMIMTIEPGIYLPNDFGVRIEDMLLITETGNENLTHFPKKIDDIVVKV